MPGGSSRRSTVNYDTINFRSSHFIRDLFHKGLIAHLHFKTDSPSTWHSTCKFSCRNSYKCGAFFESLPGAAHSISWIGAMPDALSKNVTNKRYKPYGFDAKVMWLRIYVPYVQYNLYKLRTYFQMCLTHKHYVTCHKMDEFLKAQCFSNPPTFIP